MSYKRLNGYIAAAIFLLTFIIYALTTQSSVAFWDAGELAATAVALEVPHPPGPPLFLILGRLAMIAPLFSDPGFQINLLSGLCSALTITFMYLIGVRIISRWRGLPQDSVNAMVVFASSAIGALTFSVTDTFWFNAVESEVFAMSMFFVSCVVWLAMVWYEKADEPGSERYLLLIAYLMGLSIGVHQLSLLAYFTVALLVYFRYYEFQTKRFIYFIIITLASFAIIFPVIVEWLPNLLNGTLSAGPIHVSNSGFLKVVVFAVLAAAIYGVYKSQKENRKILSMSLTAALLIIVGYSTYTLIILRANSHPPINENNPGTLPGLVGYLNRSQYGQQPPLTKRRWDTADPVHIRNYQKYSSDWDFFWNYQLNRMFLRYLGFNFIGRSGDIQDAPVAFTDAPPNWFDDNRGYPARYFGIPFILALFGLWHHFKKDWKFGLAFLTLFVMMGFALVMYFNMFEPQPRERDYFFVGAFFGFALWIGIGVSGLISIFVERAKQPRTKMLIAAGLGFLFFLISPFNMFAENRLTHDRRGNYIPWDYSYNILQSCKKNAILFTNGDNDTFPLWYLQEVAGVRTDIRIVNLSLVNTDWYILQLKNETPHGAATVPISYSNEEITRIMPIQWRQTTARLPVSKEVYKHYGVTDSSITNRGFIEYTINPTVSFQDVQAIRVQDLMIKNILETNDWRRPVYFSVTVAPSNFIGLDSYLQMQGMALEVMPYFQRDEHGQYPINADIMRKCLMDSPKDYYRNQRYGFRFTNMNDADLYFDDNARNLTLNYRNPFMRLASYYLQNDRNSDAVAIMDSMESKVPIAAVPMDYRIIWDVARMYMAAGAEGKFRKYADVIEKESEAAIERDPIDVRSPYNPYRVLLDLYSVENDYGKQIDLLTKLMTMFPNEKSIEMRISQLRELQKAQASAQTDSTKK